MNGSFGRATESGEVSVIWDGFMDSKEVPFKIYFRYDVNKTDFTRLISGEEKVVASLNYVLPVTEEHIKKARNNIRIWQVFS